MRGILGAIARPLALAATFALLPSCGMFKRRDATDALTKAFARSLDSLIPPLSTLNRETSDVLYKRLGSLFPGATDTPLYFNNITYQYGFPLLPAQVLNPQQSSQIFTALVGEDRPSSSVALMAWRALIESVCAWNADIAEPRLYSGGILNSGFVSTPLQSAQMKAAAGAMFSEADVLMDGETLPDQKKDPATYLAFLAARNTWLYPYTADSPEVQALAALYNEMPALVTPELQEDWGTGGPRNIDTVNVSQAMLLDVLPGRYAKLSMCMAALMAPQFVLGNLGRDDVVRRIAWDLLGRRPTFKEISDYHNGRLDLNQWIAQFQQTDAYLKIVDDWHRDILGLRPFLPGYTPDPSTGLPPASFDGTVADPRPFYWASPNTSSIKVRDWYVISGPQPVPGIPSTPQFSLVWPYATYYSYQYLDAYSSPYVVGTKSLITDYGAAGQPFDPRTAVLLWETKASSGASWVPRMAWVLKSLKDSNPALLSATYPGLSALDSCVVIDPSVTKPGPFPYPLAAYVGHHDGIDEFPTYYLCTTTGDTFSTSAYNTNRGFDIYDQWCQLGAKDYCKADPSFYPAKRYRRFSPATVSLPAGGTALAEQNGLSAVKSWYSGQTLYISNSLHRFVFTCQFRPHPYTSGVGLWDWAADYYSSTPTDFIVQDGAWADMNGFLNPYLLNQFRCGAPDPSKLDTLNGSFDVAKAAAAEEQAYPFGYDHHPDAYAGASLPAQGSLNSLLNLGTTMAYQSAAEENHLPRVSSHNEGGAILRLHHEIENEPIHLLNYILSNHRPYTELVTANYTVGGPELELFYRTLGYQLPRFPDGADFTALQSASLNAQYWPDPAGQEHPSVIDLSHFGSVPYAYLAGPTTSATQELPVGYDPATPWPNPKIPYTVATNLNSWGQYYVPSQPIDSHLQLPARVPAGILDMAAFLGPVATRARTVSSRFFLRFLCGAPNVVELTPDQQATHVQYMASPQNPKANATAGQHISRQECRDCHLNLDPLAQALFPNFLNYVQLDERLAISGSEFVTKAGGVGGGEFIGLHPGPWQGTGAFLGQVVSGPAQVGQVLSQSHAYHNCVVRQTFQHLFGREAGLPDAKLILQSTRDFEGSDFDYNALVRELATSPNYLKEE